MRELFEFRIEEKYAHLLFNQEEGIRLGDSVRRIRISKDDQRFNDIGRLQFEIRRIEGGSFFYGWYPIRTYSQSDLENARLFYINRASTFEPAGEECGTKYDETAACSICGAGRKQETDLILDLRKVPKRSDIARTIANEWVVSQHFAEILVENHVTGVELRPVHHKARYQDDPIDFREVPSGRKILDLAEAIGVPYPTWQFWVWVNQPEQAYIVERATEEYTSIRRQEAQRKGKVHPLCYQLIIVSQPASILTPPTQFGINPFDEDSGGLYCCPLGHVLGLNILSEVWIKPGTWDGSDVVTTSEAIGVRRGLLVPEPLLLISPQLYKLMTENKIKGYHVEVAYIS